MRQFATPTELGEKVLSMPFSHESFVDAEIAIRELIKQVETLSEVLRGRTDIIAEWMEKCQKIEGETAKKCAEMAEASGMNQDVDPLATYIVGDSSTVYIIGKCMAERIAVKIKEKFGLEI